MSPRQGIVAALLSSWVGRLGVALFGLAVSVSIYVLITFPLDFGARHWSNPARWTMRPTPPCRAR
jgi:peptide/nickel transport system permease protein